MIRSRPDYIASDAGRVEVACSNLSGPPPAVLTLADTPSLEHQIPAADGKDRPCWLYTADFGGLSRRDSPRLDCSDCCRSLGCCCGQWRRLRYCCRSGLVPAKLAAHQRRRPLPPRAPPLPAGPPAVSPAAVPCPGGSARATAPRTRCSASPHRESPVGAIGQLHQMACALALTMDLAELSGWERVFAEAISVSRESIWWTSRADTSELRNLPQMIAGRQAPGQANSVDQEVVPRPVERRRRFCGAYTH